MQPKHDYDVRPRKDHRGVDLISDALPFGRLWYAEPNAVSNGIGYAQFYSRSHHTVIRVYDSAGFCDSALGLEFQRRPLSFVYEFLQLGSGERQPTRRQTCFPCGFPVFT